MKREIKAGNNKNDKRRNTEAACYKPGPSYQIKNLIN